MAAVTPSPVYCAFGTPGTGGGSRVTGASILIVPLNGATQRRTVSWSGDCARRLASRSVICWLAGSVVVVTLIGTGVLSLDVSNVGFPLVGSIWLKYTVPAETKSGSPSLLASVK